MTNDEMNKLGKHYMDRLDSLTDYLGEDSEAIKESKIKTLSFFEQIVKELEEQIKDKAAY